MSLAWCAGFLDGEGSFGCYQRRGRGMAYLSISAKQVRREPLDRLVERLGGKVNGPGANGRNAKPIYQWRIDQEVLALTAIEALYPHLSLPKQEQIDRALTVYDKARMVRCG